MTVAMNEWGFIGYESLVVVNPLIRNHEAQLARAGQKLFTQVGEQMKSRAYANWKTMMYEALVRAVVIRYFVQHDVSDLAPTAMIEKEKAKGFFWIEQLNDLLAEYENKRDIYPSLASFMPQVVAFYNQLVPQIDVL